jgi:hypothetical protein
MSFMKIAAVSAVLALGASAASAATCSITDVQYSSECIGRSSFDGGSPDASDLDPLDGGGWMFVGKEDDSESSPAFDITLDVISGTYTVFSPLAGYDYALALKGGAGGRDGQFFAAYLLTAADIAANLAGGNLSGTFNMSAFTGLIGNGDQTPALSNATLFKREGDTPPPVVPLPAAGWLLIAGIGGLAALKRKKRAA